MDCRAWPIAPLRGVNEPEEDWDRRFFAWRMRVWEDPHFEWMNSSGEAVMEVSYDEAGKVTGVQRTQDPRCDDSRMIWSKRTSDTFDPENPAHGSCAVTALLMQDLFGGKLLRTVVGGRSHYYNEVAGLLVDVTGSQFTEEELAAYDDDPSGTEERSREYVVSFPETRERYRSLLLAANVAITRRLYELMEEDNARI